MEVDSAFLQEKGQIIRGHIIEMLAEAGSGHTAGSLGMADIFAVLYFHVLRHNPQNPFWEDRDRLVLSNGHICPVQYAALAESGYFSVEELKTLRKISSRLQGHPHRTALPGLETSSGPLGEGLGQAAGIALAGRMDKKSYRVYCVTSDGEHQEGSTWESVLFAAKYRISNLVNIIDYNNIQISGFVNDVMPLMSLREKYEAFGWQVIETSGHDVPEILQAFEFSKNIIDTPTCIIAHTIPGKGVSFMEGKYEWHGKAPNIEEAKQALVELNRSST